ncbi:MAG: hypothetical protein HUJ16_02885, partial [Kangiella sp.]|nr:hypothetical protein [Kangiella sp.]
KQEKIEAAKELDKKLQRDIDAAIQRIRPSIEAWCKLERDNAVARLTGGQVVENRAPSVEEMQHKSYMISTDASGTEGHEMPQDPAGPDGETVREILRALRIADRGPRQK